MKTLIYLLQVSSCTAIFFLFYKVVLQKLTFFTINRFYLIVTLALSFIIPAITIPGDTIPVRSVLDQIHYEAVVSGHSEELQLMEASEPSLSWSGALTYFYFGSTTVFTLHFLASLLIFFYKVKAKRTEKIGMVRLIRDDASFKNGSFLNYIFLNGTELSKTEAEQILSHEYEHIRRYHSLDKIFSRVVQIVLWFNPVSYLYSQAIEINHEFEVDQVVSKNTDKSRYAELIFKLSTQPNGQLFNHFSKFPLKTRLNMLFTKPSRAIRKIAYLFLLPVILFSCIAFANRESIHSYKNSLQKLRSTAKGDLRTPESGLVSEQPLLGLAQKELGAQLAPTTKKASNDDISAINGLEKLGKNPLVEIDGKIYDSGYLYKIGKSCISGTTLYLPKGAIAKYGEQAKDGAVSITTKNGQITYLTPEDKENIKAEQAIPKGEIFNTYTVRKNGEKMYGIRIQIPSGGSMSNEVSDIQKVGFMMDDRVCDKREFVNFIKKLGSAGIKRFGTGPAEFYDLPQFETVFWFSTKEPEPVETGYNKPHKKLNPQIKGLFYSATDSVITTGDEKFIYLYGRAFVVLRVSKQTIYADYVTIDTERQTIFAKGRKGQKVSMGTGSGIVKADSLIYNYGTQKGKSFGN